MDDRIKLTDVDRPDEPLDVQIDQMNETTLRVSVPGTVVKFELRRNGKDGAFEGALGGRYFSFDPAALDGGSRRAKPRRK